VIRDEPLHSEPQFAWSADRGKSRPREIENESTAGLRGEGHPANSVRLLRPWRMAPSSPGCDLTEVVPIAESSLAKAERGKCPGPAELTELIAAKLNSWNGEEVKRTRPSPAFRSLTLPPRRLCSDLTSIEERCLCKSEHFWGPKGAEKSLIVRALTGDGRSQD
jgi:hypothetical protein